MNVGGITQASDGAYYVWGGYHGYDDGTTHDPLQRMVSRLHGFTVAMPEQAAPAAALRVYPNPASGQVTVRWQVPATAAGSVQLHVVDVLGRTVLRQSITGSAAEHTWDLGGFSPGTFWVTLLAGGQRMGPAALMVKGE